MHARNAASVFPEPVGAEISVVRPARMCGHACSCGSVGVPNFWTNQSLGKGFAHAKEGGTEGIPNIVAGNRSFAKCLPGEDLVSGWFLSLTASICARDV